MNILRILFFITAFALPAAAQGRNSLSGDNNRLYIVTAVILIIWGVLSLYIYSVDKKTEKILMDFDNEK